MVKRKGQWGVGMNIHFEEVSQDKELREGETLFYR